MRQWRECNRLGMMRRMLSMRDLETQDLQGLTPEAITALAAQMLQHIQHQAGELHGLTPIPRTQRTAFFTTPVQCG